MSEVNKNGNTAAPKVDTRKTEINKASLIFNQLGIWIIVAGLIILGMIISKGQFFGKSNIQSILEAVALTGMVCAGLFYVTYSGNMTDMSVPITMAFGGVMAVQCINFGFVGSIIAGLLAGALIGLINGFMIGSQRHHLDTGGKSFDIRCHTSSMAGKNALRRGYREREHAVIC